MICCRPIKAHVDRLEFTVRRVSTVRGKRRTRSQHNDVDIVMSVYPRNPWIDGGPSDGDRRLGISAPRATCIHRRGNAQPELERPVLVHTTNSAQACYLNLGKSVRI